MADAGKKLSSHDLYINAKAPYGFNYVYCDLDVTHDNDDQGENGSHVAGIAAANRFIRKNGEYVDALSEVFVAGTAPDAQILVMKVFGKNGGAFDSDILVSIEDALVLGADSVNLSLGSVTAGASYDNSYTEIMERIKESGIVYRTGKLTVRSMLSGNHFESPYKSMSSFSSFGVPGDLSLKPDITAPAATSTPSTAPWLRPISTSS